MTQSSEKLIVAEEYQNFLRSTEEVKRRLKEARQKSLPDWNDYWLPKFKEELKKIIQSIFKNVTEAWFELLEVNLPPPYLQADLALSVFRLAEVLKRPPAEVAEEITQVLNMKDSGQGYIERAEASGPFINLTLKRSVVYQEVLFEVDRLKDQYGRSDRHSGETALIEYSSPNIAKPIGVGHLRSTIIGQALANLYEAAGYAVVRDNFLGDWGTQFGKVLWAYLHWGRGTATPPTLQDLKNLYVRFHEAAEVQPELEPEAADLLRRLEQGDKELVNLWKEFRALSLAGFASIYQKLGITFDTWTSESYFLGAAEEIISQCLSQGLCHRDKASGAVVAECPDLPSFLLQKSDGSSLYLTRDLAALKFRLVTWRPAVALIVVGEEQTLRFKQLFALAQALDYLSGSRVEHISFGSVLVGGKRMSTRGGSLVELEDLMRQAISKAREIIIEKNPNGEPTELDRLAEIIGLGALIYNDLRQSRGKNISLDWQRMFDFEGASAAYLQYTVVRIRSILKQVSGEPVAPDNYRFEEDKEFTLVKKLLFFPSVIFRAQTLNAPHFLANYLEELAQLFNGFYGKISVIGTADKTLRYSRLKLVEAVATVLENGLRLLNIRVPEKM